MKNICGTLFISTLAALIILLITSCDNPKSELEQVTGIEVANHVEVKKFFTAGGKDYLEAWKVEFRPRDIESLLRGMKKTTDETNSLKTLLEGLVNEPVPPCIVMKKCDDPDCLVLFRISETSAYLLAYKSR